MEKKRSLTDILGFAVMLVTVLAAGVDLIRYIAWGSATAFMTELVIYTVLVGVAFSAWKGRMPWLLLINAVGGGVVFFLMNYTMTPWSQPVMLVQTVAAAIGCVWGTVRQLLKKEPVRCIPWLSMGIALLVAVAFVITWQVNLNAARDRQGAPHYEIWAVPEQYDAPDCQQAGTLEELVYQTKAYGTDGRAVEKRALVYLPYGYDESKQYNILYLMHGTGDDENYWLRTNPQNKHMLDRMIASGAIEPLIVVTPTFYTEDDCADNLDVLTFAFKDELRNDLMVAVESKYSTFAESCDEAGFVASRDHRAFAGLSRGGVTTCHSALCGSLDYFSWFGIFSAFRTGEDYLRQTMQSEEFKDYPIHYLYMTSGNFDFALNGQLSGYAMLLEMEPRLTHGVNADFDIYPMRYHGIGNWQLALYNLLQRIF